MTMGTYTLILGAYSRCEISYIGWGIRSALWLTRVTGRELLDENCRKILMV